MKNKEFDIIFWGATGFTGKLVVEYMLRQYGLEGDLKWAMAARNENKIKKVQAEIGATEVPVVIADSNDMDSLFKMTKRTKVICTTVGPYAKYGSKLVEACIANQTDYCDLTGEVQWIRKMINQHHDAAKANGTRIVNCCGFDSIPSDLGVYFFQKKVKEKTGNYAQHIKMRVKAMKGGMSGGTYASLSNVMAEATEDKSIYKTLLDPYGLNPEGEREGLDKRDLQKVVYDEDAKSYLTPFVMASINTKVVRRSHALMGFPYGKNFMYDEAMLTGTGVGGKVKGYGVLAGMGLIMAAKPGSFLKKVVDRRLPKPGEGPTKEEQENGFYKFIVIGKMEDGTLLTGSVKGDRDPGYGSTSKMLSECAVCLAKDKDKTPNISGLLTPASALGDVLLERLEENAGLSFKVDF